jgi:hypothetical protein
VKTVILKGAALEHALELDLFINESGKQINELLSQARSIQERGNVRCAELTESVVKELGLPTGTRCFIERELIAEHKIAFARIGDPPPEEAGAGSVVFHMVKDGLLN